MTDQFIRNFTPHQINLLLPNGGVAELPPDGGPGARVTEVLKYVGDHDGFPIVVAEYGAVVGLPDQEPEVLIIVSAMVRAALPHRIDLVSPADLVRDSAGRIIGCRALMRSS